MQVQVQVLVLEYNHIELMQALVFHMIELFELLEALVLVSSSWSIKTASAKHQYCRVVDL